MFASTTANQPVTIATNISPQKEMIEFSQLPLKKVYHLSVFMLPNVQFDNNYTALVYYQFKVNANPGSPVAELQTDFKLIGGLSSTKQSAIFKVNPGNVSVPHGSNADEGDIDMDSGISESEEGQTATIVLGISIEPNESAMLQLNSLKNNKGALQLPAITVPGVASGKSTNATNMNQQEILQVSNRIIGNAYNFLSSFADNENKVSLNKFNDWWNKFKMKMANDPEYLEKLE